MNNLKSAITHATLWFAFTLALIASLRHVAWVFGTMEFAGEEWYGWLAAIAVDAGLAALAYAIQQRRRAKRPVTSLWLGVSLFALISAYANATHALTVRLATGDTLTLDAIAQLDPLAIFQAILLSATLPALVVYLGEIVSTDDAYAIQAAEHAERRAERRAKRKQESPFPGGGRDREGGNQNAVLDAVNAQKIADKDTAMDVLISYLDGNPHASLSEIGRAIGRSKSTAGNYVQELTAAGRLHRNGNGWTVSPNQ